MKLPKIIFLLSLAINIIQCEKEIETKDNPILEESITTEKKTENSNNTPKKNEFGLYPSKELILGISNSKMKKIEEIKPTFDIERFLKEFDDFDCNIGFDEDTGEEIHNEECLDKMSFKIFDSLGEDNNKSKMFNSLNENVYRPLGYVKEKKNTIASLLIDAMDTDEENKKILDLDFPTNYGGFENMILESFSKMEKDSSDMENNKDDIKGTIKKILTSFHLYWNTLRSKNMTDKIRVDTKAILRNILRIYEKKEFSSLNIISIFTDKVKEMYSNFIKAYQFISVIKLKGYEVISREFIKRYENIMNIIKTSGIDSLKFIYELAILLDFAKAYNIMSTFVENKTQTFQSGTIERIKNLFHNIVIEGKLENNPNYISMKHFTIVLLLKLKHVDYLMTSIHKMNDLVERPELLLAVEKFTAIKVHKEFFDMLILVPRDCKGSFLTGDSENCIRNLIENALQYIATKYSLKRSISGLSILNFISDICNAIINGLEKNLLDFHTFKTYYYQNLFSQNIYYQKEFHINGLIAINNLENILGNTIRNWKEDIVNQKKNVNFGLYDQLEVSLYERTLDLRGDYDSYSPISNKSSILFRIQNDITHFFDNFYIENNSKITENFNKLIVTLKNATNYWRINIYKRKPLKDFEITVPFSASNLYLTNPVPKIKTSIYGIDSKKIVDNANQSLQNIRTHNEMIKEVHNPELYKEPFEEKSKGKFDLIPSKEMFEKFKELKDKDLAQDVENVILDHDEQDNMENIKNDLDNSLSLNKNFIPQEKNFGKLDTGILGAIKTDFSGSFYTGGGD